MDQKQIIKQVVEFNRAAFNGAFYTMSTLQDQNERLLFGFLDKASWIPTEGKKAITDWVSIYKKSSEDFKSFVEDNFKKAEEYFS